MPKKPKPGLRIVPKGRNLTAAMVNDLGAAIVTGKFSKKNPFPVEADIAVRYRVSRAVVREAVKMLTAKGLLAARARQGTWILPEEKWNLFDPDVLSWLLHGKLSQQLLLEFAETRLAVECAAAALAAVRATFQQKAAIERALARIVAAEHGEDDPVNADIAFHLAVLKGSGNRFLMQFQQLVEIAVRVNALQDGTRPHVDNHRNIVDAIIAGDADAAYRTTRTVIARGMERMTKSLETGRTAIRRPSGG